MEVPSMRISTLRQPISTSFASVTIAIALIIIGLGKEVRGQVLSLTDPKGFYETYLDTPPLSIPRSRYVGPIIVGIRMGGEVKQFQPGSVRVLLGSQYKDFKEVCIRILSRDGRYFARGLYRVDVGSGPTPQFEFHTSFQKQLSEYATNDMAIYAVDGVQCNEASAKYYFSIAHNAIGTSQRVTIQVRAGDARVHAQFGVDNAPIGSAVLCEKVVMGPTVGFTHECVLNFKDEAGEGVYQLNIGETSSDGSIELKRYSVILDKSSKAAR
jgi:hypothetical protein